MKRWIASLFIISAENDVSLNIVFDKYKMQDSCETTPAECFLLDFNLLVKWAAELVSA